MKNLLTPLLLSIAVVSCSTTGTEDMASDVTSTATSRTEATVNTATAETTELLKALKKLQKMLSTKQEWKYEDKLVLEPKVVSLTQEHNENILKKVKKQLMK